MRTPRSFLIPLILGASSVVLVTSSLPGCGGGDDEVDATSAGGAAGAGGAGGSAGTSGAGVTQGGLCGNGKVEKGEDCDDGNTKPDDGCDADCSFTCASDAKCDDKNPCNGTETCVVAQHLCKKGTPIADGADCAPGKVCLTGSCLPPSCGDGKVQMGEECDDGNAKAGDGCEPSTCQFTCKTGDATRDCKATNACVTDGTCGDASTHTCTAGAPKPAGTACGAGLICAGGQCKGSICGDGFVDAVKGEQCDDGNTVAGDGCEPTCKFTCSDAAKDCAPAASICVLAACDAAHKCAAAPDPTKEGQTCGNGLVCAAGTCQPPSSVCGNGKLEPGEICDDGNKTDGDGCQADCKKFTCSDAAVDCAGVPVCQIAQCNDVSGMSGKVGQVCGFVGDAKQNGMSPTGCAVPKTCQNGACSVPGTVCGNNIVEAGEECDFGAMNGPGKGCEISCTFSCATSPDKCADANPCNGAEACGPVTVNGGQGQQCQPGTPLADGSGCSGGVCLAGVCKPSSCGDGIVDSAANEQCDFGAGNGANTGCEATCKFSCTKAPDSCPDANPCNGTEACGDVTVGGKAGQKCAAGPPLVLGASCGGANICIGSPLACVPSVCGDSYVDAAASEQCDPPNGTTCDAQCKTISVASCGNKKLEGAEECDDGNTANLDGCDSGCKYELTMRMTQLTISANGAPVGCTPQTNFFGKSVLAGTGRDNINTSLKDGVSDGSTNVLVDFLQMDDLTGVADPSLSLGVLSGQPDPAKGAWPGTKATPVNPIDWWYLVNSGDVDGSLLPVNLVTPGSVTARKLVAGPSDTALSLLLGGVPALLQMRSAMVFATLDGAPAPNVPAPPPGALKPGLTVFQTTTATTDGQQGLCGNITVESLAAIPIPESLTTTCVACSGSKKYTYCGMGQPVGPGCNSLLDAIVGGCKAVLCLISAVNASPTPDVAGNGTATLTLGAGNKVPAAQTTGNTRAYSAYLLFKANRAHLTGKLPLVTREGSATPAHALTDTGA